MKRRLFFATIAFSILFIGPSLPTPRCETPVAQRQSHEMQQTQVETQSWKVPHQRICGVAAAAP
jgi:hypothetical protein